MLKNPVSFGRVASAIILVSYGFWWQPNIISAALHRGVTVATFGGWGDDYGIGIALDGSGNSYITGRFTRTVDFDPGVSSTQLTSAGENDAYVLKLDSSGDLVWAKSFGGSSWDAGSGIAVDGVGNSYANGSFTGTVDFDPG